MATITDVAKRAGVSTVTVSRVINAAPNVNSATRERVGRAIRELGYVPSVAARSLRSKRTRSLGLIVPDITNTFWTTVARGVEDAAQRDGYSVLLCNTDEDLNKQQRYLDLIVSQGADGVIIAPCNADAGQLAALRERDIATAVIDRRVAGWDVDTVYADSFSGAYALTRHLISLGHTRIAMLSGPEDTSTGEDRVAGYRLALAGAGIEPDPRLIRRSEFTKPAGAQMTGQLLGEGLTPTAIFAANNAIALGVIEALGGRGLHIPRDIALVCFDDFPPITSFFPFLTVIAQPAYDMGANAAQLLLSRLDASAPLKPRRVILPVRLVTRYSCGAALSSGMACPLNLPLDCLADSQVILVKTMLEGQPALNGVKASRISVEMTGQPGLAASSRPDVNRLRRVLQFGEADRIPHVELRVAGRALYESVLERELKPEAPDARLGIPAIPPEVQVEFAQRIGLDAIACEFSWLPEMLSEGAVRSVADLARIEQPAVLAAQLSTLERYLRAAQGAGVGVFASFDSFFATALRAVGCGTGERVRAAGPERLALAEQAMDLALAQIERLMQAVCDRFAADLAFVMVRDAVAIGAEMLMPPDLLAGFFSERMKRLVRPALEHGVLTAFYSGGTLASALPFIQAAGFGVVYGFEPEYNDLPALKRAWLHRLVFMGGISETLLCTGSQGEIAAAVRQLRQDAGPTGFVFGSATGISERIRAENFIALVEAVQRFG